MTTHYKTVDVPATTKQVESHTTCNICNTIIKSRQIYCADENRIEIIRGDSYPESGSGQRVDIDLCDECVKQFLLWVVQAGGHYEWKEWEW